MRYFNKNFIKTSIFLVMATIALAGCQKDEYYIDGGTANPAFDGTVLQYLESKPVQFDSLVQVVKLAGLEDMFNNEEITFFAPTDRTIKDMIGRLDQGGLNWDLYTAGRDTIQVLSDVDSLIWRKYLLRHVFKGKNKLMDYPQIDFGQLLTFPGEYFYSYNNAVSNIGVVFNDAEGVRYLGYRRLHISYVPDVARPTENWYRTSVSSSDIQPSNGVVHILDVNDARLGFNRGEMSTEIFDSKR